MPVRWNQGLDEPLDPLGEHPKGVASGVNNDADVVGRSYGAEGEPSVPTLWDADGTATLLPSPLGGDGDARRINNQGYVVGVSEDPLGVSSHAILWLPGGGYCDLDYGSSITGGVQITDVSDGTVLVAGSSESGALVWEVQVVDNPCDFQHWTMGGPDSWATDVRRVSNGWEAVGIDASSDRNQPMVWRWDGIETTETPVAKEGSAAGINFDGRIVGAAKVKRSEQAVLWTPNPN